MQKISTELDSAIHSLFDDPEEGYFLLGYFRDEAEIKSLGLSRKKPLSPDQPALERISILQAELEKWIVLHGQQIVEFEGEDVLRIRSEARGILLALRELQHCFPELNA